MGMARYFKPTRIVHEKITITVLGVLKVQLANT